MTKFMFGLLANILMSTAMSFAETPPVTPSASEVTIPAKQNAPENLDDRIETLQSTKNCIAVAKTKSEIEQCRRNVHLRARPH